MNRLKVSLLNVVLKHLWNGVLIDEVLQITNVRDAQGKQILRIRAGKEVIPELEAQEMTVEAKAIKRFRTWERLKADMRSHAALKMVNQSKNVDDMVFSKAMLYAIDMMERKLDQLAGL